LPASAILDQTRVLVGLETLAVDPGFDQGFFVVLALPLGAGRFFLASSAFSRAYSPYDLYVFASPAFAARVLSRPSSFVVLSQPVHRQRTAAVTGAPIKPKRILIDNLSEMCQSGDLAALAYSKPSATKLR
jgi:hypothetical protein